MNRLNSLFLALIISIGLTTIYSCQKEGLSPEANDITENVNVDLSKIKVTVKDGILHFDEGYFEAVDLISNATEEQLDAWEQKIGFQSQQSIVNNLYEEIDALPSEAEYKQFLRTHSDVLQLKDSHLSAKIDHPFYARVTNLENIYYVGESLYKVFPEKVIEIRNGDKSLLAGIESIEKNVGDNNVFVYPITKKIDGRSCNTFASVQTSNRGVVVVMFLSTVNYKGSNRVKVTTKVSGVKRVWGNWSAYRTKLRFECGAYRIRINGTDYSYSNWASVSYADVYSNVATRWVGPNSYASITSSMEAAKTRASSRGVGDRWAVICCNFGSNCPSTTGGLGLCN